MYPEPGQRKAKDLLYLAHSLDGSMASIALDDDSQNSTDSSNLNVDEIWKSMNSDLPKTSIAMGVAGGQQSASVQAMLNKISATAKKKEKKAKKKNKKQKAGDASGNNKRKSNKKKLKKQIKHTVDSILRCDCGGVPSTPQTRYQLPVVGRYGDPERCDIEIFEYFRSPCRGRSTADG